jgi:hypothetical protein
MKPGGRLYPPGTRLKDVPPEAHGLTWFECLDIQIREWRSLMPKAGVALAPLGASSETQALRLFINRNRDGTTGILT